MKKLVKRIFALVAAICICSAFLCASAVVDSSLYLDSYSVTATARSTARVIINVDVDATGYMDEVGATSITIYRSADGVEFEPVRTYDYEDYPQLMGSGLHFNEDVITYYGIPGYYYCAAAYVYAGDETGSDSRYYLSNSVQAFS